MTTTHTIDVEAERETIGADKTFQNLLDEFGAAACDAWACGRHFGTAGKLAGAESALIAHIDARLAAKRSIQPTIAPLTTLTPKWEGEFKNFDQWVNKAQSWLISPSHRPAVCIDTKGRRCAIGKDFMLARDEDAFPVRFFWECQPTIAAEDVRDAAMEFAQAIISEQEGAMTETCVFCGGDMTHEEWEQHDDDCVYIKAVSFAAIATPTPPSKG